MKNYIRERKKIFLVTLSSLLLFLCGFYIWSKEAPKILTNEIVLAYGQQLKTTQIKTSSDVVSTQFLEGEIKPNKVGTHDVLVRALNKKGNHLDKKVKVTVIDENAPEIKINKTLKVEVNSEFNLSDYLNVVDDVDGDLINKVKASKIDLDILGKQEMVVEVRDSSGNESTRKIEVEIVDTTAPIIKASNVNIKLNEKINFNNIFKVSDNFSSVDELKERASILGDIEFDKAGNYPITYTTYDSSKNEAKKTIVVSVKGKGKSKDSMMIYLNKYNAISYAETEVEQAEELISEGSFAVTYGEEKMFNPYDGKNNHFVLSGERDVPVSKKSKIYISDKRGKKYRYEVKKVYNVHDNFIGIKDGKDYSAKIIGAGKKEMITLQIKGEESDKIIEAIRK